MSYLPAMSELKTYDLFNPDDISEIMSFIKRFRPEDDSIKYYLTHESLEYLLKLSLAGLDRIFYHPIHHHLTHNNPNHNHLNYLN